MNLGGQIICEHHIRKIICVRSNHIRTSHTNIIYQHTINHMWTSHVIMVKFWTCLYVRFIYEFHRWTSHTESVPTVCEVHMCNSHMNITYRKCTKCSDRMWCSYVQLTYEHHIHTVYRPYAPVCAVHMWTSHVNLIYQQSHFTCEHDLNWDARSHVNHTC